MPSSLRLLHSRNLLPTNPSAGIQSNQSSCNNKDDAEDDDDARFLFGPILTLSDGVLMERARGEGESGGWDGGHGCGFERVVCPWDLSLGSMLVKALSTEKAEL